MALFFLYFIEAVFGAASTLALMPPQNIYWPKVQKVCRSEAIGLRLVETDTWHCLGYFAGTDLVKLS